MDELWNLLGNLRTVQMQFTSACGSRNGIGQVRVISCEEGMLDFLETGKWVEGDIAFTNKLRWVRGEGIELYQWRFSHPVHLVTFVPGLGGVWRAEEVHCCGKDVYIGYLKMNEEEIELSWNIKGPKKNDLLVCRYR